MGVQVPEGEAAAVQEHQSGRRPGGDEEPARHPVGVDVLDPVDGLVLLGRGRHPLRPAHRGHVVGAEAGVLDARPDAPQLQGVHRLRVEAHSCSRASSSSTTDGSSFVNTGAGLATGVPATTGRRRHAGMPEYSPVRIG